MSSLICSSVHPGAQSRLGRAEMKAQKKPGLYFKINLTAGIN
jgi:hypothetical protein